MEPASERLGSVGGGVWEGCGREGECREGDMVERGRETFGKNIWWREGGEKEW